MLGKKRQYPLLKFDAFPNGTERIYDRCLKNNIFGMLRLYMRQKARERPSNLLVHPYWYESDVMRQGK